MREKRKRCWAGKGGSKGEGRDDGRDRMRWDAEEGNIVLLSLLASPPHRLVGSAGDDPGYMHISKSMSRFLSPPLVLVLPHHPPPLFPSLSC